MSNVFGPVIDDSAANFALLMASNRAISSIIPDVVIEELHHDPAVITQHPVETGTPVADHMFFMPETVEMRPAWSDSSPWAAPGYSIAAYQELVALQQTRQPFTLITGKRAYQNMQIRDLAVKTDVESENSLLAVVIFQQVNIVSVTTTGGLSGATPPNTDGSSVVAQPNSIAAQNAAAAGLTMNPDGSVSWGNAAVVGGTFTEPQPTTSSPTLAQVQDAQGVP